MSNEKDLTHSSSHGDSDIAIDADGSQLHGLFKMKHVLYYKHHSMTARPTARGTLLLQQPTLSFRSKGLDYCWDLNSIAVVRFKGRTHLGMKIFGRRQNEGNEKEEYIFTKLNQSSYELIRCAIDEAKVERDTKEVEQDVDDVMQDVMQDVRQSLRRIPLLSLSAAIVTALRFIHELCTGRRLLEARNMRNALSDAVAASAPIVAAARATCTTRQARAVERDVRGVYAALANIATTARVRKTALLPPRAAAAEAGALVRMARTLRAWRQGTPPPTAPATVGEAVRRATASLAVVTALAARDAYPPGARDQMLSEAERIERLLCDAKVHGNPKLSSLFHGAPT